MTGIPTATYLYPAHVKYNLHHKKAIQDGGAVYDVDNILITAPKYHSDVF